MVVRRALILLLVLAACHGSDSPTDPKASQAHGRLAGVVSIGPNCPVERVGEPCPTPPEAYAARKVLVSNEAGTTLIATVDIDAHGLFLIDLVPGKYLVDLKKVGIDRVTGVPAVVEIRANTVTALPISVDTGIR